MIDGVMVKQLRVLPDERGRLMEILREDDEIGRASCRERVYTSV